MEDFMKENVLIGSVEDIQSLSTLLPIACSKSQEKSKEISHG